MTARKIPGVNLRLRRGPDNPCWKGGRNLHPRGYVRVSVPGHPRGYGGASYVFEHILVAERALGRLVPVTAHVHHVDGDKANNAPGNLVVCQDAAYHRLLHQRTDAWLATGNADARKCCRCGEYGDQSDIRISRRHAYHRTCHREHCRRVGLARKKLTPMSAIVPSVMRTFGGER